MRSIWILGDQLSLANAALQQAERSSDVVLIIESRTRGSYLRYHKKRLVLVYAGLRHFASSLRDQGWQVDHYPLEHTPTYETGLKAHLEKHQPAEILLAEPNDWPTSEVVRKLAKRYPISLVPTAQFLVPREEFRTWAGGKTHLIMEHHYRRLREKTGYLMNQVGRKLEPEGKTWNLDHENRRTYKEWVKDGQPLPPARPTFAPDEITRTIMGLIDQHFPEHPGQTAGFHYPVTRDQALRNLDDFIIHRLGKFGPYEDLMVADQPSLFHSVLTPSLNLGLLSPAECVEKAIAAYQRGQAPLNSVEGFVRQIIGWREFINGVYWLQMPDYQLVNALGAERELPAFFYTGETPMNCLHQTLSQVLTLGYNHHIQRLMVLGNFLLLAGVRPSEALRWFLEMYVDAWDWVMAANVLGMILYADGGYMATKPYAAGSGYIHKMSNYCEGCRYKPALKTGPDACPFNYLYWHFFDQHAERFENNPRVMMPVRAWKNKTPQEQQAIRDSAREFLARL